MNGKKAKAIRRRVYGDQSTRQPRQYLAILRGWVTDIHHHAHAVTQRINKPGSLRALYQAAKRGARA